MTAIKLAGLLVVAALAYLAVRWATDGTGC